MQWITNRKDEMEKRAPRGKNRPGLGPLLAAGLIAVLVMTAAPSCRKEARDSQPPSPAGPQTPREASPGPSPQANATPTQVPSPPSGPAPVAAAPTPAGDAATAEVSPGPAPAVMPNEVYQDLAPLPARGERPGSAGLTLLYTTGLLGELLDCG